MSHRFALVLLTLLFPLTLGAQRADTTMVPRELVAALIAFSDYSGNLPEIVVGRVPAGNVSPLVPRGAAVLGGVTYGGRRDGGRSTTILSMMETPDSALALVQAQIERAGWKLAPLPDMGGREGFAIGPTMPGRMVTYCSDSASVYTSIVEGANRGSIVRLMSTPSLRNTMCDPDRRRLMRGRMEDMIRLPTLRPPPGSSGGSMGSGGGGDSRESHVRLQSTLGARRASTRSAFGCGGPRRPRAAASPYARAQC